MREVEYEDVIGRKFKVLVPDGETNYSRGIIVGPPFLDSLNLPIALMVRVHNALYDRNLLTITDITRRPQDVQGAIMSAIKVDIQTIVQLYRSEVSA